MTRGFDFWGLQIVGWLLVVWMTLTQCLSAIFWDQAVEWGLQEGADQTTEVGAAFGYGFAFGDLAFYVPIFAVGLIGHAKNKAWGGIALAAALGITVYWPIVSLAAVTKASNAPGWMLEYQTLYWIILPPIILWAVWGLWRLSQTSQKVGLKT